MVFDTAGELSTEEQEYNPTPIINEVRTFVESWRNLPNPDPAAAGLHLSAMLSSAIDTDKLINRAASEGIGVEPLKPYFLTKKALNGLAFGYGLVEANKIELAINRLAKLKELP